MNLSWIESLFYGFITGVTEILPVSSRAHSQLLLRLLGGTNQNLCLLMIHLGVFAALYYSGNVFITRVMRAIALSRIPKRKRKRPLDTKSLMDFRLWRTTIIPTIAFFFFYGRIRDLENSLLAISILVFINGFILYLPQFFGSSNKDSRNLSRIDGLLMGLGCGLGVLPGISGIGAALSVASVCGVERQYAINLTLLTDLAAVGCLIVHDILAVMATGPGIITAMTLIQYAVSALAGFFGCLLAIRWMRKIASTHGCSAFAYYCWGVALLVFILNLLA